MGRSETKNRKKMPVLIYMLSDMQIKVTPYKVLQKARTITYWVICVGQSRVWTHNLELQQEEATLAMQIPARYKNISGQDASGWNINQRNWWFLQGTLLQVYLNDMEILRKRNFSITVHWYMLAPSWPHECICSYSMFSFPLQGHFGVKRWICPDYTSEKKKNPFTVQNN